MENKKITKIISCADIHFPQLKQIDDLKEILTTFLGQCKKIIKKEGAENVRITILGDIFHNKNQITPESMLAVNWFFTELDKLCKTIVIGGNHDFIMNNTGRVDAISPLFQIGTYKQVIFLDKEFDFTFDIL